MKLCLNFSGIFVALALRFDVSRGKESQYFKSAFLGYTFGLVLTIVVMNWFQAAQVTLRTLCSFCFVQCMPRGSCHFARFCRIQFLKLTAVFLTVFQPALLYIVPAVLGFLAVHVICNGEVKPVSSRSLFIHRLLYN